MNKEHELLWALLPDGLEEYFEVEGYEKTDQYFRIVLVEKNTLPPISGEYVGKKVVNTVLKSFTVDDFAIRGRKGELILKRRCWKFDGIEKLLKRNIDICVPGTKLEKEFAAFLKEMGGE